MVLPDVNVLIHAFRIDAKEHERCSRWLDRVINGPSRYGMSPQVLSGVIRVTTHPRVFVQPSELAEAFSFCEAITAQPNCVLIEPGRDHWAIFSRLASPSDARGNLVPDAWNAALAIESGCEWITLDRDYARFKALNWRVPE